MIVDEEESTGVRLHGKTTWMLLSSLLVTLSFFICNKFKKAPWSPTPNQQVKTLGPAKNNQQRLL